MFTGIIQHQGIISRINPQADGHVQLWIASPRPAGDIPLGASIACDGICLTVEAVEDKKGGVHHQSEFQVTASQETVARTMIGNWKKGKTVNLEGSLQLGDELGRHLVFGHVDAILTLLTKKPVGQSSEFCFELPQDLAGLVVEKGSITLNGVSLTVNHIGKTDFSVTLIPHSLTHTNFHLLQIGDKVNVEADMLARYVLRQTQLAATST